MAKIFITGSADGLGHLAAKKLLDQGHEVVIHARSEERAREAKSKLPSAGQVLIGDLSNLKEVRAVAEQANSLGVFDAVIHNAGIYQVPRNRVGAEGFSLLFTVNSLAPYLLTCLMHKPRRLIYMSSGMHLQGDASLKGLPDAKGDMRGNVSYSDTKLHDLILALAMARKWKDVSSNAVNPGWVPTKMGGAGAPDSLEKGYETQVWLAASEEPAALSSGRYLHHKKTAHFLPAAADVLVQDALLSKCAALCGVSLPQ